MTPAVSVVMGVYNGEARLADTLQSVLSQQDCDFECIVVDDGSTDGTAALLAQWAQRDARLRVVHQPHGGLTAALARGCAAASGEFIARQDCGDISLPGRLARQCALLRAQPQAVLVASAVQFLGPHAEPLFVTARTAQGLHEGLARLELEALQGPPHHGATMFRRTAYEQAGGYRLHFAVAQDIDLWLRLWELGRCVGDAQTGYVATLEAASISARRRTEQFRYAALAIACARARRTSGDDTAVLAGGLERTDAPPPTAPGLERARFYHFVGSCLRASDPAAARRYFWRAFREHPLMVKSLIRWVLP